MQPLSLGSPSANIYLSLLEELSRTFRELCASNHIGRAQRLPSLAAIDNGKTESQESKLLAHGIGVGQRINQENEL